MKTKLLLTLALLLPVFTYANYEDTKKVLLECSSVEAFYYGSSDVIAVKQLCQGITSAGAYGEDRRLVFLDAKTLEVKGVTPNVVLLD